MWLASDCRTEYSCSPIRTSIVVSFALVEWSGFGNITVPRAGGAGVEIHGVDVPSPTPNASPSRPSASTSDPAPGDTFALPTVHRRGPPTAQVVGSACVAPNRCRVLGSRDRGSRFRNRCR
jgi:hypothetical protein